MDEGDRRKRDQTQNADANLPVQARFLAALSLLNPEVLRSLRELSNTRAQLPGRRELKQWARRWNLEAEWLIDWFAYTVRWQRAGPSRRWDRFYHPHWSPKSRFDRKPPFIDAAIKRRIERINFGDWLGNPKTKSQARKHALGAFQLILSESLEEVEATAVGSALFEPRRRRSRARTKESYAPERSVNEVFLWIAGYQTRGWSRGRIAEAAGVERNAVGMAIRKLAGELKMQLRPDRDYDKTAGIETIRRELNAARAEERAADLFLESEVQ